MSTTTAAFICLCLCSKLKPRTEEQTPCPSSFSDRIICGLQRGSFGARDHFRSNLGIISGLGIICGRESFAALYKQTGPDCRKKSRLLLFCFRDTFARISRQMVCYSIKLEQQTGLIFFSRMHFVRVLSKEYHVIKWVKQNVLVYWVNLVDSLDHIYGIKDA